MQSSLLTRFFSYFIHHSGLETSGYIGRTFSCLHVRGLHTACFTWSVTIVTCYTQHTAWQTDNCNDKHGLIGIFRYIGQFKYITYKISRCKSRLTRELWLRGYHHLLIIYVNNGDFSIPCKTRKRRTTGIFC